ncbi:unnamed protein product [Cylindrotheca closterium]|uniref:Orc1-like AAA ATPase domain-containing protein n=1 Tax=Cylindrotheca closterium TaxID=2856 RepID=A0AAD2FLN0_9STRA|nr:unnamed protein product [Cylindrotheca closterium]
MGVRSMSTTLTMKEEETKADQRWCELGDNRYGEYGVIGAEQADETHLDDRLLNEEDDDEDEKFGSDGRIHFAKDKLYGRDKELAQCRELLDANEGSSIVFVSGYSGCGKSRMVEEFIHLNSATVKDDENGKRRPILFLRSKSDSMNASIPFSSIGGLFDNIDESVTDEFIDMKDEIQESLGTDARLLLKVFPKLERYLSKENLDSSRRASSASKEDSVSVDSSGAFASGMKHESKKRMMFALQFFFRTLSSRSKHQVVLFLDDLQWADGLSLELIQSILTDNTISNLFFFGGYRSNEVGGDHILTKNIHEIKVSRDEKQLKGYLEIELKDLQIDSVGHFISDSLRLSYEETLPLTHAIFTKTLGNPFFTRQALEHLVRKNALFYDNISFRWDWKLQEKELKDLISDDLLEMVKAKIEHLEPKLQEVLMTASCTRSTFDVDTILVLLHPKFLRQSQAESDVRPSEEEYHEEKKALVELLNQGIVEGLLLQPRLEKQTESGGDFFNEATGEEYAFAHDKIQETARSLVCDGDESEFLERMGNILQQRAQCPLYGEDWMFFCACEHLNRVSMQYKSVPESEKQEARKEEHLEAEQRFRLATLNLRTAKLSIDLLAFPAALDFCEHGIAYLPADDEELWSEKYKETAMHLFSIAAQAKYGVGDNDAAERFCKRVIAQHKGDNPNVTIVEALPAFHVYLDIIGDRGEKETALELCLELLYELGIAVPKSGKMLRAKVWWTLKQIERRLPTEESVINMPHVTDPLVVYKMELIQQTSSLAYTAKKTYLYMLLCCESVKHIVEHGLTDTSAASIASFANVLMHVYNDFKTSPQLAELAILIADRQQSKFNETQPLNTANNLVLAWVRPLSSRLKYHQRAYESGLVSGNMNGAMVGKWFGFQNGLFSCRMTLPQLEGEFQAGVTEMRKFSQHFLGNVASIAWQVVLNLIGKSGNPNTTVLTGAAIDESTELYQQKMPFKLIFGPWKSMALLFFGDYKFGAEYALQRGDAFAKMVVGMMYGYDSVFRAIPLFIMARSNDAQGAKYKKEALKLLKRVRTWVKKGCTNLVGPYQIIEAEYMASKKKAKSARSYFEMAVTSCRRDNFHQYAGLSCELYSDYLAEIGDSQGSKIYLQGAINDYRRWGAARKVDMLKKKLAE